VIILAFGGAQHGDDVLRPQFLSASSPLLQMLPEIRAKMTASRWDLVISKLGFLQWTRYRRVSHGAYIKCGNSHSQRKVCNWVNAACGTR
jgi:hypothetical protein